MAVELTKEPRGKQGSQCLRIKNNGLKNVTLNFTVPTGTDLIFGSNADGQDETKLGEVNRTVLGPSYSLYFYVGHATPINTVPDPWKDVTTINGDITNDPSDPTKYQATFSRSALDQATNPTQATVDVYISEGGGRGHGR